MRNDLRLSRVRQRTAVAIAVALSAVLVPGSASAEGIFDFLFGGAPKQQQRPAAAATSSSPVSAFADPFAPATPPKPVQSAGGGRSSGYCVRMCDGKYFPVVSRGGTSAAQMCQAFCPASTTRLFSGSSNIEYATSNGERYADIDNAFAYRKELKSDCTCNGRDTVGLAPVDLAFDTTLKAGDVVATADGLMAYTGIRLGNEQAADFTPVSSYPGLTASVRAKLGEMKVAPVSAEVADDTTMPSSDTATSVAPITNLPKSLGLRGKRAGLN